MNPLIKFAAMTAIITQDWEPTQQLTMEEFFANYKEGDLLEVMALADKNPGPIGQAIEGGYLVHENGMMWKLVKKP